MLKIILKLLLNINQTYKPAACLPDHCFCETIVAGPIRQPINAYSNLAYILVALLVALHLAKTKNSQKSILSVSSWSRKIFAIFVVALVAVGLGSFLYHSGFTFVEQEFDDDSMYLVGSFLLLFSLAKLKRITVKQFLACFISLNLAFEAFFYFVPAFRPLMFATLLLGTVILEGVAIKRKVQSGNLKYLAYGLSLFAVAFVFWFFDYTKIICFPNSYFQGHTVWHILTALATLMMYFFMESTYKKVSSKD